MRYLKLVILITIIAMISLVGLILVKSKLILNEITIDAHSDSLNNIQNVYDDFEPYYNPNRINILLLGIRGVDDDNGGLLTDTILLVSINKLNNNVALAFIPRDIYVNIPGEDEKREKINAAYAIGESRSWNGGGLLLSKSATEFVTGQKIDYALSIDFEAFRKIVDVLGGIEIELQEDFSEKNQWRLNSEFADVNGEFFIPKGRHTLDSETALYYIRSRFSSNDFDRGRRVQDVLIAVKEQILKLEWAKNPKNIFELMDILGSHVKTDMGAEEIKNILRNINKYAINSRIILSTVDNILIEEHINNQYVLLPRDNSFEEIRKKFNDVFSD